MPATKQLLKRTHHNSVSNSVQQGMHSLSITLKQRVYDELKDIAYPFPDQNYEHFVTQSLQAVCRCLPTDIVTAIRSLKNDKDAPGFVILDNFPIDKTIPLTPVSALRSDIKKTTFVSEALLTGISALIGEPIGSPVEKEGSLLHDIIPKINTLKPLSNEGSSTDLGLHVENAIMEHREHFVILFGQRQDRMKQAITPVACITQIMRKLDQQTINELYKAQFIIRKPYILDHTNTVKYSEPVAILQGPSSHPEVRATLYMDGTKATTSAGQIALQRFKEAANQVTTKIKIKAGQMVIINNFKCLHGRSAFDVFGDGFDRYLLRSYVVDSLWDLRDNQKQSVRIVQR